MGHRADYVSDRSRPNLAAHLSQSHSRGTRGRGAHSVEGMEEIAQITTKLPKRDNLPGSLLPRAFFEDSPEEVAPRLLGKLLVHKHRDGVLAGRIVEVEAYLGPHNDQPDPAAHAHRGPTPRNLVLFGPAGHAYVYAIYGMHFCMNISCEADGLAGSVLLRALDPVSGVHLMAANRGLPAEA